MVEKIYNDILELLKSDELRNDLLENYTNLNIKDYEDIITHAPVKLGKKIELLEQLREVTKNNQEKDGITVVIENGRKAIRRLYKFDKSKSVLLLKQINGEKKAGLTVHKVQDNFPVVSYSSALDYIAKRVNEQVKSYARPRGIEFMPYWYWEIELYDMKEGHSERIYKYICSYLGDVLYYICYIDSTDSAFRGGNLNLPVPYRPGDILKLIVTRLILQLIVLLRRLVIAWIYVLYNVYI